MPRDVDEVKFISEGTIGFINNHYEGGYCDLNGNIIIKPKYRFIYPFSNGLAQVYDEKKSEWPFVDKEGVAYFHDKNEFKTRAFSDGLCPLNTGIVNPKTVCFIDKQGQVQLCLPNSSYFFYNNNLVVDDMHTDYLFRDGVAVATIRTNKEKSFLFNKKGEKLLDSIFDKLTPMINGLSVASNNRSWGLINRRGIIYDIPQLTNPDIAFNKDGTVALFDLSNYCLLIDSVGNYFNGMNHDNIYIGSTSISPSIFSVNNVYGYFNDTLGIVTIPPSFNDALPFSEDMAAVKIGSKWGYIDKTGEIVIPTVFEQARPFNNGRADVVIDEKKYFIDKKGTILND